eukprot:9471638-Pyramimonas_sp.AAC.1
MRPCVDVHCVGLPMPPASGRNDCSFPGAFGGALWLVPSGFQPLACSRYRCLGFTRWRCTCDVGAAVAIWAQDRVVFMAVYQYQKLFIVVVAAMAAPVEGSPHIK